MNTSKYNLVCKYNDSILIFNSLTGKSAVCNYDENIYRCLINGEINDYKSIEQYFKLINEGFVVDVHQDEVKIADMKKSDFIYENTLKLEIIPTLFCNFDCPYCYERHNSDFMSVEIQNALKKFIAKNISNYSAIQLFWFGGEPLLAKDFVSDFSSYVKKLCQKHCKKYSMSIVTNGYLLDDNTFEQLYNSGIRRYQITFDGSQIYHDKKRFLKNGLGSYEKILHNLVKIKTKKGYFNFNIRCNITKENCNDINNFLVEMNHYFGNDLRFKFYFRPVGDWGGSKVKSIKEQLLNSNYDIYNALMSSSAKNIDYSLQFLWLGNLGICESNQRNYYVINPYGELLKCTKHLENPNNKVGYINDNGNMVLDNKILSCWISNSMEKKAECLNCKSYANCFGIQCPINTNKECDYSETVAKQFLILQYQCNPDKFIKI